MALDIIGPGFGRTGTSSLKTALEHLGYGPAHHMFEVRDNPAQLPLWQALARGEALDWNVVFDGYRSQVDWPGSRYWRELVAFYPDAKVILTVRDPERWYESFTGTIFQLLATIEQAPEEVRSFLEMGKGVTHRSGFSVGMSKEQLIDAFNDHCNSVREAIPSERLLVYEVKQGWEPLCEFLEKPVPDAPFPRTNSREEFWEKLKPED